MIVGRMMDDKLSSAYATLGLAPDASEEAVRQAYRDLIMVWHPDRFAHSERLKAQAQQKTVEINAAYERVTQHLHSVKEGIAAGSASTRMGPHDPRKQRHVDVRPPQEPKTRQAVPPRKPVNAPGSHETPGVRDEICCPKCGKLAPLAEVMPTAAGVMRCRQCRSKSRRTAGIAIGVCLLIAVLAIVWLGRGGGSVPPSSVAPPQALATVASRPTTRELADDALKPDVPPNAAAPDLLTASAGGQSKLESAAILGQAARFAEVCKTGTPEQVTEMLKAGVNVNRKDVFGQTPLMAAAGENADPQVITALVKAGADVKATDMFGQTPMMWAGAKNPNPEVIAALARAGADANTKDKKARTPLVAAAGSNPSPAVIAALVKAGADINARDKDGGTPLMFAAANNEDPAIITAMVQAGAQVNAKDRVGFTPLMSAAWRNPNPEVIQALIKAGANINATDENGRTALTHARTNRNTRAVAALTKAGAW